MPQHQPTSAEYQHLLNENDMLRSQNVWLRNKLKTKEQTIDHLNLTIDHLNLRDRDRGKHIGDLHEQIYQLGVANRDLEAESRNLKFDKEHLLERLTEKQQFIINGLQVKTTV